MITYIDNDTSVTLNGVSIPKGGGNRHYNEFLELLAAGEAELVHLDGPTLAEVQAAACTRIRDFCQRYIYASYSPEKQTNLTSDEAARATAPPPDPSAMYSHDDFLRYHAFKSEARGICNYACGEVQSTENEADVEAIMTELEHLYGLEV